MIVTTGGWKRLQRTRGTKELRGHLWEWAQSHNITADWCLDHAVRVLREWMYDDNVRLLDVTPLPFRTPGWLIGELGSVWQSAINSIEFSLVISRSELAFEVFPGGKGGPAPFVFEREGLPFETTGWNYLQEGKELWKKEAEREFDKLMFQRKAKGQPPPKGVLTALRRDLAEYLKKGDAEKRIAVRQHGLVKRPRRYAAHTLGDHIKWLVMYQIPPCQAHTEIAGFAKKTSETVRKCVGVTAKKLELKLRDDRLHAGRPAGESGKSPHRITYRQEPRRQKRNAEK